MAASARCNVVALNLVVAALLCAAPAKALLDSPVTAWFDMLEAHVRATTAVTHQLACTYYAGLAMTFYNSIKCNRNGTLTGAPAVDDLYVLAFGAHSFLNNIYPTLFNQHDALIQQQLSNGTSNDIAFGRACGVPVAQQISKDWVTAGFSDYSPLNLGPAVPGAYQMTPGQTYLMYTQMGSMTPYVLSKPQVKNITKFFVNYIKGTTTPPTTPYFGSDEYYSDLQATYQWGNTTSALRQGYNNDTPPFWNDGAGTSTAAGQFLNISKQVFPATTSLLEQVRFFSAYLVAMSDACIPCFGIKYTALLWRPWTAILTGDNATFANGTAKAPFTPDNTWKPYLAQPPHPSYPSGHSCISGAATQLLIRWTGADNTTVTAVSEGLPTAPMRTYTSFSSIAVETGMSRVLGGLHYWRDVKDGVTMAVDVANIVYEWFQLDATD